MGKPLSRRTKAKGLRGGMAALDTTIEAPDRLRENAPAVRSSVLCVDMDGTYLRTDTLYECLLVALKSNPRLLLHVPVWLLTLDRLGFKQRLTHHARGQVNLEVCPRQPEVEALIARAKAEGKRVELITAADQGLVAENEGLRATFDTVIGSTDQTNLKAEVKADLLRRRHPDGFAYVGNSPADLAVWRAASERYGVNLSDSVRKKAAAEGLGVVELATAPPVLPALVRAMRPHQWLKNLLIFVPLALVLGRAGLADIARFLLGFACLGLMASGTYLVNDMLDIEADRRHPRKRRRAIASGDLPMPVACAASVVLVGSALLGGMLLGPAFAGVLIGYLALTLAYSLQLKRMAMVDVLVIAALFTLRIVAGMMLVSTPPSHWLLMFSIFLFFSLALMKREVELNVMSQAGAQTLQGRGYALDDRIVVVSFGVASAVASLVIFSLFISATISQGAVSSYGAPNLLWGALALLGYWIVRMWLLTTRGLMNDDPILYAAKDRTSLALGALVALLVLAAQVIHP